MSAVTFTTDQVITGISNCSNTRAFGRPDKHSIFHLKKLGPRAIEYITALFNDSVTSCQIPAIWKSSIVIPIPKPGKDSSLGTSYRPISLLCPAKVMTALILNTVNTHRLTAFDQLGFRHGHSITSALLQLTSNVATGFNQRKPPHRTICVAVDLTAALDTVNHNVLLSKIARSTLPEAAEQRQIISYELHGRQVKGKDNPYWRSARLEVVTNAIQFRHS